MNNSQEVFHNDEAEEMLSEVYDLLDAGDNKKAERVAEQAVKKFPKFYPALAVCGDLLLQNNKPIHALVILRRAVKMAIYDGNIRYLLGVAYMKVGRFHLAEQEFETARGLLAENGEILSHLGRAKMMLGKFEEAEKCMHEALKHDYANPFIHADMAQIFINARDFDSAIKWLESARALEPDSDFIKENLRIAKQMQVGFGRMPAALQKEERGLAKNPDYSKQLQIDIMLHSIRREPRVSEDDAREITEEMRRSGLSGQIAMFKNPNDPKSRAAVSYIKKHDQFRGKIKKNLSDGEYGELERILIDKKRAKKDKEEALLTLARQGTEKAEKILSVFKNNSGKGWEVWAQMALEECQMFLESEKGNLPPVKLHKLD